jgi:multidrug efflux pump subunit AcrA (membrane-fusion protein)
LLLVLALVIYFIKIHQIKQVPVPKARTVVLAKVNLQYCHISSPVNGRIGLRLVDPGNFVQTTDTTGIAIITTLDPITIIFVVPEDDVPKILPLVFAQKNLSVQAFDRQQNKFPDIGFNRYS